MTLAVVVACMFALVMLNHFLEQGSCVECGGIGGHKEDCRWND